MPLVAQLGGLRGGHRGRRHRGARSLALALMAMFDEWNWRPPCWLDPSCRRWTSRSRYPRSKSTTWSSSPTTSPRWRPPLRPADGGQVRGKLKNLRPIPSPSPTRWRSVCRLGHRIKGGDGSQPSRRPARVNGVTNGRTHRNGGANGNGKALPPRPRPVHPVTMWRGRLSVALDALRDRRTPPARRWNAAARWRPPTSSCPPATGCRYRPARRRCV